MVNTQAGQMREGGVWTEAVVAIIGADLQRSGRNHETLIFELLGDGSATVRRMAGNR